MPTKPQVLTNKKAGKAAEALVAKVLTNLKFTYERIPDTGSVAKLGITLPPRRGDFDLIHKGNYFIFEVKTCGKSMDPSTVPIKGTWRNGQLAAAVKWGKDGAYCYSIVQLPKIGKWFICNTTGLARKVEAGVNKVGCERLFFSSELEQEIYDLILKRSYFNLGE